MKLSTNPQLPVRETSVRRATVNGIVDISHWEETVNFAEAKRDGIVAVISKATQGVSRIDKTYHARRAQALELGLLWGSYHFGDGSDVDAQVKHYADFVRAGRDELVCLDFEPDPDGNSMSIEQAREFVRRFREAMGRYPVLYGGHWIKYNLRHPDPILSRCPLWIAEYALKPTLPTGWERYVLWQYTDGRNGPFPQVTGGIGRCDRNIFPGSKSELRAAWPFVAV